MAFKKVNKEKDKLIENKTDIDKEEIKTENLEVESNNKVKKTKKELELEKSINEKRLEYLGYAKKNKTIGSIISVFILIAFVSNFVILMKLSKDSPSIFYTTTSILIVILLTSYITSKLLRKKLLEHAKDYLDYLYTETDKYVFYNSKLKNYKVNSSGQFKDEWFIKNNFYKDIKNTKSRNFIHFENGDDCYDIAELAANSIIKGKLSPKFLGYFYSVSIKNNSKGKQSVFQLKGKELSIPLDGCIDLKIIEDNKNHIIYSNDQNVNKIFNQKLINKIKEFKINKPVIDLILSIKDNNLSIGVDYDDEFLSIPVKDKEFKIDNAILLKQHYKIVEEIIDLIKYNINITNTKDEKSK
ncbi:MAG: hypothetical protein ACTTID_01560 [Bacillales bacterium]